MTVVNLLFIGDIMGRAGREVLAEHLPRLRKELNVSLVIANGENAAGRAGITSSVADELWSNGVDVITLGDHAWDQKEIVKSIEDLDRLIRPANFARAPGKGFTTIQIPSGHVIGVVNLLGRVFIPYHPDCPFRKADEIVTQIQPYVSAIIIDFHAEATSEKVAMGWYLDGRVSAVIGTHTHVQTGDERVLPGGTAFLTDAGMTGPADGVIGIDRSKVIERFITQMPVSFEAAHGARQFNGVLIKIDLDTGRAIDITRVTHRLD